MRHSKIADRLLTIVELLLLAAIVLWSLYLIYGYVTRGEAEGSMAAIAVLQERADSADAAEAVLQERADSADAAGVVSQETMRSTADANSDETIDSTAEKILEDMGNDSTAANLSKTEKEESSFSILSKTSADESTLVRVQILDNEYSDALLDFITISGGQGFAVEYGTYAEDYTFLPGPEAADEAVSAGPLGGSLLSEREESEGAADVEKAEEDGIFLISADDLCEGEALHLIPGEDGALTVTSLERADGSPTYEGDLYIYRLEDGLALVNVLSLREYLCGVVSSEMPSGYPAEALKAQAVCARTFVLQSLENGKNEKNMADLDDSVRFQVYNNYRATDSSRDAVDQTDGEILLADDVQYYSTSCLSEKRDDLGEEEAFREFLSETVEDEAEYGSVWVRWQCEIPAAGILEKLDTEYDICAECLDEVAVVSRGGNGQALLLRVTAGEESVEIAGEYAIRQFLSSEETEVVRLDETTVTGMQMLPSAFFYIDLSESVLCIYGGGYGHGNGMSQSGAAQMASQGASCEEILEYYFGN
ncbi:MAG: SpoIID/LytB domain-containing protein [Lachnospiraceae bacterium]|nr:SpoIID/LytB domain-containing protein [Lachnospiraceae bacterium]